MEDVGAGYPHTALELELEDLVRMKEVVRNTRGTVWNQRNQVKVLAEVKHNKTGAQPGVVQEVPADMSRTECRRRWVSWSVR